MDCAQFNPQGIPLPSRRGWLGRCLAGTMLISLSWAQPAHADWADERAIARLLLYDFAGALQDLNEAISRDHDTRMLAAYVQAKKASSTHLRQAIPHLEMGDLDQAAIPIRAAIDVLLHAGTQQTGNDFLSPQLLLMQSDLMAAERLATQLPSSPALGAAGVKSWGKIIYDPELSSQTRENYQKAYDAADELFAKYKIVLDNPVTMVVTANTESYIQKIMLYGDLSRAEAEHRAISPYVNMGVSSRKKPAIVLRWIPTRQLTSPGVSHLVNNPQEGFVLPHEVFHQVQNQYGLAHMANWLLEGSPELFKFMALETAGFKRVTDSVQLAEQVIRRAKEIPDTRQLASYDYKTWSSLARQGYPIYPMAAIMMARLVGDNGFEKLLFFHKLLHDRSDPDKAFVTAFGVPMSDFLTDMNEYFNKLRTDVSSGSEV